MDLQLVHLRQRLQNEGKGLTLSSEAKAFLGHEGYSFEYGARNLGRALLKHLSEPMARMALLPEWDDATGVEVRIVGEALDLQLIYPGCDVPLEEAAPGAETEKQASEE